MSKENLVLEKYHEFVVRGLLIGLVFIVIAYSMGVVTAERWHEDDATAVLIEPREAGEEHLYIYKVTVNRVIDGDTMDCRVDLGFDVAMNVRFRLAGINAPEVKTEQGEKAKLKLEELCPEGAELFVDTIKDRREKYGRYLGYFLTKDGRNVNELLVAEGFAVRYP